MLGLYTWYIALSQYITLLAEHSEHLYSLAVVMFIRLLSVGLGVTARQTGEASLESKELGAIWRASGNAGNVVDVCGYMTLSGSNPYFTWPGNMHAGKIPTAIIFSEMYRPRPTIPWHLGNVCPRPGFTNEICVSLACLVLTRSTNSGEWKLYFGADQITVS